MGMKNRLTAAVGLIASCAAAMTIANRANAQPAKDPSDPGVISAKLFNEAQAARQAKDFEGCIRKAEEAFNTFPQATMRGLQGVCENELNRFVDAATHLAFFIEKTTAPVPEDAKKAFERAEARLARVTISSEPRGAAINVDGRAVGNAPLTIYLEPGEHTFVAVGTGGVRDESRASLVAGTKMAVSLEVRTKASGDPPTPLPMWPAVVGFSVAGVGALLGGGMLIASAVRRGDASSLSAECTSGHVACVAEGQSIVDEADTFSAVGVTGVVVAGAALAFSIPYVVVAGSARDNADAARLVPIVSPGFAGAVLRARF